MFQSPVLYPGKGRTPIGARRVFILYRSPLFAGGLSALLSKVPGLEVVGMGPGEPEGEGVWSNIQLLAPDVIILEQEDGTPLARALDAAPGAQLVALSLSHSRIRIYEHRDVQGWGLEDVIEAIAQASPKGRRPVSGRRDVEKRKEA